MKGSSRRTPTVRVHLAFASGLILCALPWNALATRGQISAGPSVGFHASVGRAGGFGGMVGAHGGWDITDAFRIYSALEYGLGALSDGTGIRHHGAASAGLVYTLDAISILPWFGLGARVALMNDPGRGVAIVPMAEARGGFDWLMSRYLGFTLQLSYGVSVWNRDVQSDEFNAAVGVRFTADP